MGSNVLIIRPIPDAGLERLRPRCQRVEVRGPAALTDRAALLAAIRGRDGVVCDVGIRVDRELIEAAAPTCRVIANFGVGVDHIDVATATRLGIVVTNTPAVLTDATADLTWALLLAVARRVVEGDALVRSGRWTGWAPIQPLGLEVTGRTLGIVGAGRIGTAVALRSMGFQMPIVYVARRSCKALDRIGARRADLDACLGVSDFVSLHVPLTLQTRHLIGKPQLARMKPTAVLINTARGPVVEERALVAALRDGVIAGAGLDVYEFEPHPSPELLSLPNVVCLPHVGSATLATRSRMAEMVADNVIAVLEGRQPPNPVTLPGEPEAA